MIKSRQINVPLRLVWNYARNGQIPEWGPIDRLGRRTNMDDLGSAHQNCHVSIESRSGAGALFASKARPCQAPSTQQTSEVLPQVIKDTARFFATYVMSSINWQAVFRYKALK